MHQDQATDLPHQAAKAMEHRDPATEVQVRQATEVQVHHRAAGLQATVREVQVEAATAAAARQAAGAAMEVAADTAEAEAAVAAVLQAEEDKTT